MVFKLEVLAHFVPNLAYPKDVISNSYACFPLENLREQSLHLLYFQNVFVILYFSLFLIPVGAKFKRVGSKVKVIINDVIKPNVIIQPKSIIGFMPLKIKDNLSWKFYRSYC